jgi:hypothetical protein
MLIVYIFHTITTVKSTIRYHDIANIHLCFNIEVHKNRKRLSDFVEHTAIEIDGCLLGYSRIFAKNNLHLNPTVNSKAVEIYRPKTNFKELMSNNNYIILIYKYINPEDFTTVCDCYVDIWLIMFIRALKV